MNWAWYAVGALTVIPLSIWHARMRYLRWIRRHSYVAEIKIRSER